MGHASNPGGCLDPEERWRTVIGSETCPEPCHEGAVLVMVKCRSRQERRMDWILVSKATVRLSRLKILRRPECVEREDVVFDFEESCFSAVL